jgi:hypothetical protein
VHDVGGLTLGPIDRSEHDLALWEKRTAAMLVLVRDNKRRVLSVDAHRRTLESYGEQEYDRITYYARWIRAIRNLLVEQNVLTRDEIEARLAEVRAKHEKASRKGQRRGCRGEGGWARALPSPCPPRGSPQVSVCAWPHARCSVIAGRLGIPCGSGKPGSCTRPAGCPAASSGNRSTACKR